MRPDREAQAAPVGGRGFPLLSGQQGQRAGPHIGEGDLVRRHHADAAARLDRHVAERHARFHRQRGDRGTGVFDGVPDAAIGADLGDQREDDILHRDALPETALEQHTHRLLLVLAKRLGGEDAFAFAGADPEGEGSERAMGRGVAVAAYERNARQGEAEFRADDVNDPVLAVRSRGCSRCRSARSFAQGG